MSPKVDRRNILSSILGRNLAAEPITAVPVEIIPKTEATARLDLQVSCADCIGACCLVGEILPLSESEHQLMMEAGTEMIPYDSPKKFRVRGRQSFELTSDCGLLVQDETSGRMVCSIYNDPRRPKICGEMAVGSYFCRFTRARREIHPDEQERFRQWDTKTLS